MNFLKKIRIPLIILILLILVVISIVIIRNVLVVARNNDAALDFANEMPSNLDDIFSDDFLDDQIDIDTSITEGKDITPSTDMLVDADIIILDPERVVDLLPLENLDSGTTRLIIPTDKVDINAFLIDKYDASRRSPTYITLVIKAPLDTSYVDVKVFARKLSKNNEILSRELVFTLPKVYIVNGQGQTQFYFSGRYAASRKYVSKGRYIMYAEISGYDNKGDKLSATGGYPMPKMNNVITIR